MVNPLHIIISFEYKETNESFLTTILNNFDWIIFFNKPIVFYLYYFYPLVISVIEPSELNDKISIQIQNTTPKLTNISIVNFKNIRIIQYWFTSIYLMKITIIKIFLLNFTVILISEANTNKNNLCLVL